MPTKKDIETMYAIMERFNCDASTALFKRHWIEKIQPEFIEVMIDEYREKHEKEN